MKILLPALVLLLLAACQRGEEPTPPTAAENAQLDEAEAMLDRLANEEGAVPEDSAPANSD
ncbi:MAG TPA: hypothetical protein VFR36_05730 [Sphingomicrobium sp.]|nr:hypothetical protein [Sphingomicrobium sp.]